MVSDITCKISFSPSLRLSQFLSEFFSGEMKYYDISALNFEPFSSISSENTARTSQKYETFSQFSFVGKLMLSNGRSNWAEESRRRRKKVEKLPKKKGGGEAEENSWRVLRLGQRWGEKFAKQGNNEKKHFFSGLSFVLFVFLYSKKFNAEFLTFSRRSGAAEWATVYFWKPRKCFPFPPSFFPGHPPQEDDVVARGRKGGGKKDANTVDDYEPP